MTTDHISAEFRRQLRSLFVVLRAIVRRSANEENSNLEFAARLEGRISALARVHDMLMRPSADGIDLEELVHGEFLAQAVLTQRYRAIGPDTRIGREAAMPVAMAIHELTMNALLHGILLESDGTLELTWDHVDADGHSRLSLLWQEMGARRTREAPTTKGFGLELLEKTLPYELSACTRVDWTDQGVRVGILLPRDGAAAFWRPGERPHST
jgi:two-component sensor histidine kinase